MAGILQFILGLCTLIVIFIIAIGIIAYSFDTRELEKENAKLREDLKKARARKVEKEYEENRKVK